MEMIFALLLAMTVEVSDARQSDGSAKAHKPSGKSAVTKPLDVTRMRFPLLEETVVCQPMPASDKPTQSKTKGAKMRPDAHCVVIRPIAPTPKRTKSQRAHAPKRARVASATSPKTAAKLSGKKKKSGKGADAKKEKWVPERVFVRPSVSIGAGR